jgi:preprotein translocase subunit SecF
MKIINFYSKKNIFFILSALIILTGVVFIFINGIQLDIQFKGGTIMKYGYSGTIDKKAAQNLAVNDIGRDVTIQENTNVATGDKQLVFNVAGTESITSATQQKFTADLKAKFPKNNFKLNEASNVAPYIGQQFLMMSILAVVLASIIILFYVWIRFRRIGGLSAGLTALASLYHDVLIVTAIYIIFGIPISDSFIAVVLIILGYSIYDTIVVFDRVRENRRLTGNKLPIPELVNMSITQTLARSINTTLCTFFSIAIVFTFALLYGIDSITSFALPMMIGILSGCYSTIFIAGPLWVMWQNHKINKANERKKIVKGK